MATIGLVIAMLAGGVEVHIFPKTYVWFTTTLSFDSALERVVGNVPKRAFKGNYNQLQGVGLSHNIYANSTTLSGSKS